MGCATTRSKAATAIQKWSRATAGICWLCMLLRRPPEEQARSTVALPRLVRRFARQSSDTPALALPLGDARTKITFDYRLEVAREFYRRLLPEFGMRVVHDGDKLFYCVGARTAIGIEPCNPVHAGARFVQQRVGLHHLCLRAR